MAGLTEAEVLAAAQERASALVRGDWNALDAQLHPGFVYVNAQGIRIDRAEYSEFVREGPIKWAGQRLEDARVALAGEAGVLTATLHDDVWVDGQRHELVYVTTQTYVRVDGRVLYLAGHTARPD